MKKTENYFESSNGENTVKYYVYEPDDADIKAVIQFVHGMAEHIERYEDFFEYLTATPSNAAAFSFMFP